MIQNFTRGKEHLLFIAVLSLITFLLIAESAVAIPSEDRVISEIPSASSNYVHIPDTVLKARLLADENINTNGNGEIEYEEAEAVLVLRLDQEAWNDPEIYDMTGLEAFINVRTLSLRSQQVEEVDLSALVALRIVDFSHTPLANVDFSHNAELVKITAISAEFNELDVSNNPKLEYVNMSENNFESLMLVSKSLKFLHINKNSFYTIPGEFSSRRQLTTLDVSACPNLEVLSAAINKINSLDLTANNKLVKVNVSSNQLTNLDLPEDANLRELDVDHTHFTDLDVSNYDSLQILKALNSEVVSLDLSNNPLLQELQLDYTPIVYLNLKNGGNQNLKKFGAAQTGLICVEVDDPEYFKNNFYNHKLQYAINCDSIQSAVYIPDPNFKAILLSSYANTNGDGEIQVGEAANYYGDIWANNRNISDLTGFEAFVNVEQLHASYNPISKADFSQNTGLKALRLIDTKLDSIDLTNCPELHTLQISNAELKSIDLSQNAKLRQLELDHNDLTSLDLSNNPLLDYVWANNNMLDTLILSGNTQLRELKASNNNLSYLDLSETAVRTLSANNNVLTAIVPAASIRELHLRGNQLKKLASSDMPHLQKLIIFNNNLDSLDLSANGALEYVNVKNNDLTFLDLRNGNNQLISSFAAYNNELTCINVSDLNYAYDNWSYVIDEGAGFSTDCSGGTEEPAIVHIPDTKFKSALLNNTAINTNGDGEIQVSEAEGYTGEVVVDGLGISDMTGIEAFVNITLLNFRDNNVSEIDISQLTKLEHFFGSINMLTALDPTNNPELATLFAFQNNLTSLDLTNNTKLEFVYLQNNQLSTLDVSNCAVLEGLEVQHNDLTSINFPTHTIFEVWMEGNDMAVMNAVDVHNLFCQNNQLTSLDSATVRTIVDASGNNLTSIDFSDKPTADIIVKNNQLTEAALTKNGEIGRSFNSEGNPDLVCVETNDVAYAEANYQVDEWTSFSTDCDGSADRIADEAGGLGGAVAVFPNPTTDYLHITAHNELEELRLYTIKGNQLNVRFEKGEADIRHLKKGIYILKAYLGDESFAVRIVKD